MLYNRTKTLIRKRILSVLMIVIFIYLMRSLTAYADISRYYFVITLDIVY